jgi:hypothetical protein
MKPFERQLHLPLPGTGEERAGLDSDVLRATRAANSKDAV